MRRHPIKWGARSFSHRFATEVVRSINKSQGNGAYASSEPKMQSMPQASIIYYILEYYSYNDYQANDGFPIPNKEQRKNRYIEYGEIYYGFGKWGKVPDKFYYHLDTPDKREKEIKSLKKFTFLEGLLTFILSMVLGLGLGGLIGILIVAYSVFSRTSWFGPGEGGDFMTRLGFIIGLIIFVVFSSFIIKSKGNIDI
ncbi:hypothetical protein [Cellulosilyticum sp. I15G10I2]|uniref:hypothetical protein n=1 Tax=Cellulosilyticum sp. I15G10I2 TaxID=1892843 RepID=UPI00085BCC6F|nr:hypothetical protein [Cellulosilyticum sp. I15G10I2]